MEWNGARRRCTVQREAWLSVVSLGLFHQWIGCTLSKRNDVFCCSHVRLECAALIKNRVYSVVGCVLVSCAGALRGVVTNPKRLKVHFLFKMANNRVVVPTVVPNLKCSPKFIPRSNALPFAMPKTAQFEAIRMDSFSVRTSLCFPYLFSIKIEFHFLRSLSFTANEHHLSNSTQPNFSSSSPFSFIFRSQTNSIQADIQMDKVARCCPHANEFRWKRENEIGNALHVQLYTVYGRAQGTLDNDCLIYVTLDSAGIDSDRECYCRREAFVLYAREYTLISSCVSALTANLFEIYLRQNILDFFLLVEYLKHLLVATRMLSRRAALQMVQTWDAVQLRKNIASLCIDINQWQFFLKRKMIALICM